MWCSVTDDNGKKDTNEQIFEGTERQAYVKDSDKADLRSNGTKGRKEVYASRTEVFSGRERCVGVFFLSFFLQKPLQKT